MKLLDELGIPEESYAHPTARIEAAVLIFEGHFRAVLPVPDSHGRRYYFGVDRARFDHVLWQDLARYPCVERREGASVVEVLRGPEGRVTGVVVRDPRGSTERIEAPFVVGADGRHSFIARAVGARTLDARPDHCSTVYYADWVGARPAEAAAPHALTLVTNARGANVLCFPMPDGRLSVNTHRRADEPAREGDHRARYRAALAELPTAWGMLEGASQVSDVVGVKHIANQILEPAGPGWLLVGDAFHCKDPIDGQGIYDALMESKLLAPWLIAASRGECTAAEAEAHYRDDVLAAVRPMFEATCKRLQTELYGAPPVPIIRTLIRWCYHDRTFQDRFYRHLTRDADPLGWNSPGLLLGAAFRGLWADLFQSGRSH